MRKTSFIFPLLFAGIAFAENPQQQVLKHEYKGYGLTEYRYNRGRLNRVEVRPAHGLKYTVRGSENKISSARSQTQRDDKVDVPMFEVFRW